MPKDLETTVKVKRNLHKRSDALVEEDFASMLQDIGNMPSLSMASGSSSPTTPRSGENKRKNNEKII